MPITYGTYLDKVYGGWFGKCLGGAAGAPVEGIKEIIEIKDFKEIINTELPNDDLDLQLLWLEVLQKKGPGIKGEDLADAWYHQCWYPFSEYGYFLKNYERGIKPPLSGSFNNSFFYEGMGCPIRSEIWGFISPGKPDRAAEYAAMDARLDHGENAVFGEVFLAVIESMAFYEQDLRSLIEEGLRRIPSGSKLYRCIQMVVSCYETKLSYLETREKILIYFGHPDFTNCIQNIGFIVLALLYGDRDMEKTIQIALSCGYDTDCTCASAAAVLGVILGYSNIEDRLLNLVQDKFVIGIDVKRKDNRIKTLAEETVQIGLSIQAQKEAGVITSIPDKVSLINWEAPGDIEIKVGYEEMPAVSAGGECYFTIQVINHRTADWKGKLQLDNLPPGWKADLISADITVEADKSIILHNRIALDDEYNSIKDKNIIDIKLTEKGKEESKIIQFGICGMLPVKIHGIFTEQLKKQANPAHPSPHPEGCVLPSVECMCNNEVSLAREYLEEKLLLEEEYPYMDILHAPEDKLDLDRKYSAEGPVCYYCSFDMWSDEKRKVWLVVGNSDGFKIWLDKELVLEKDEMRYWTPNNNAEIIELKKGRNRFVLKLLRRGKHMDFSVGFRKYEGKHYHTQKWITDLTFLR